MASKYARVLADWFKTLTEKTVPTSADVFLLQDAAAAGETKWATLARMLAGSSVADIQIPMIKDATTPWAEYGQAFYQGVEFVFPGTDRRGPPTMIKMIARAKDSGKVSDLRLYDLTNGKVIAEKLGITNNVFLIIDLGTITNLPTGEARWEAQGKKPGGGTNCQIKLCYVGY